MNLSRLSRRFNTLSTHARRHATLPRPLCLSVPPVGYGNTASFYCEPETSAEYESLQQRHSPQTIQNLKQCVANKTWYYENRETLMAQYVGKWLIIDNQKVISATRDYGNASRPCGHLNRDSLFIVFCGLEKVNCYTLTGCPIEKDLSADAVEDILLKWRHVIPPHPREWSELGEEEEFEDVYRLVVSSMLDDNNQVQYKHRPYITLPITLSNGKRYPVTMLIDWGADLFYLSRQYMNALRDIEDLRNKAALNTTLAAICKGENIMLHHPEEHPAMDNINVLPYDFACEHGISLEHLKCKASQVIDIEVGMEPYSGEREHPFHKAKERFIHVMEGIV